VGLIDGVIDADGPRAGSTFVPATRVLEMQAYYGVQVRRKAMKPLTENELRQSPSRRCIVLPRMRETNRL
jgi:hypothetical protein